MRVLDPKIKATQTFYADYRTGKIDAIESVGSGAATFTHAASPKTYINASGILQQTTAANLPRFTSGYYDSTGFVGQPGLLIEGPSTNIVTNGKVDANSAWNDGVGIDTLLYSISAMWALYVNAPADTANTISTDSVFSRSAKVSITNAGSAGTDIQFYSHPGNNAISLDDTKTYTVSFYAKASVVKTLSVKIVEGDDDLSTYATLDNLVTVADTWVRYTSTFTVDFGNVTDAGIRIYLGDNGLFDFYIESIQVEELPFASSFIPTTIATVTRHAELLTYVTSGNRTAATESSVAKIIPAFPSSTAGSKYIHSTDNDHRGMKYQNGQDDILIFPNSTQEGGVLVGDLINEAWVANASHIVGYSMQATGNPNVQGYFQGTADGGAENDDFTANSFGTNMHIGKFNDNSLEYYGILQVVAFFSDILSSEEHLILYNWLLTGLNTNPIAINEFDGDVFIRDSSVAVTSIVMTGASAGDTAVFIDNNGTEVIRLSNEVAGASAMWEPPHKSFVFNKGLRFDASASSLSQADSIFIYLA